MQSLKAFAVLTLALAVVAAVATTAAATPRKGPTGKTRLQCYSDLNDCRIGCNKLIDEGNTVQNCLDNCSVDFIFCAPPKALTASFGEVSLEGQLALSDDLDRVFKQLADLQVQILNARPADLVPVPRPASTGPEAFCQLSGDLTKLQVHVTNQSGAASGASTTHIEFANSGGVDVATPALDGGASTIVEFAIPGACYDASSKCHFTIGVDFTNAVNESDETNNNAAGVCGVSIF
jgi:hypothetical protein